MCVYAYVCNIFINGNVTLNIHIKVANEHSWPWYASRALLGSGTDTLVQYTTLHQQIFCISYIRTVNYNTLMIKRNQTIIVPPLTFTTLKCHLNAGVAQS
jgi:hypothetical protein